MCKAFDSEVCPLLPKVGILPVWTELLEVFAIVERARKRVRKIRVAERGIVVGRKIGGRRGLPTASNANVKTGE